MAKFNKEFKINAVKYIIMNIGNSVWSAVPRIWALFHNPCPVGRNSQAYLLVFEYINTFYNTVRIHSHCHYMSPNDYEKLYADF